MLKIYGIHRSRAARNIWLAKELGLPYELIPVVQSYRVANPNAPDAPLHTRSPAFLKVNPNGHIPTVDDDGLILHESLAINLYLARKHGSPLAPANVAEEGQMTMWTLWAATEAEPNALQVLMHTVLNAPANRDPAAAEAATAALQAPFAVLDEALAATGWLVGGRFTVADLNVAEVVRFATPAKALFEAAPRVKSWLAACHARPAYAAVLAATKAET